jgi:hypothetical protein
MFARPPGSGVGTLLGEQDIGHGVVVSAGIRRELVICETGYRAGLRAMDG